MSASKIPTVRGALGELLGRYREILKAAWASRSELAGPARMADEVAFLPAALSLQESPTHPAPRRVALVICALLVAAVAWSILGEIDIVAIAPGRIVVTDRTKTIQPLEAAVVRRVHVADGDQVKAGQLLVELDATNSNADTSALQEQLSAMRSELSRTGALLESLASRQAPGTRPGPAPALDATSRDQLSSEWADMAAKMSKLDAERARRGAEIETIQASISKLEVTVPMARQREADFRKLTDEGFVSSHAGQDRTRERIELERDLLMQKARLQEGKAAFQESEWTRLAYVAETRRQLTDRGAQAAVKAQQIAAELNKATLRSNLTKLVAPVDGTVQQLAIHTEGGVVTPAQALMVIVPREAEVLAEVAIDNKDIGFVRSGALAEVKLETFPFTRYGTVAASIKSVTADAVIDEKRGAYFSATLRLSEDRLNVDGKLVHLGPGMNLTAEIKTGKRRVIDYLLSPVQKAAKESLGER